MKALRAAHDLKAILDGAADRAGVTGADRARFIREIVEAVAKKPTAPPSRPPTRP